MHSAARSRRRPSATGLRPPDTARPAAPARRRPTQPHTARHCPTSRAPPDTAQPAAPRATPPHPAAPRPAQPQPTAPRPAPPQSAAQRPAPPNQPHPPDTAQPAAPRPAAQSRAATPPRVEIVMSEIRQRMSDPRRTIDRMELDFERCYRAVDSRDQRFDGWFVTAVTSTGIYCRPSCPAITPKPAERRVLSDRRGGPPARLSRLPALPPRRGARLARVGRPRRRRRPRDAADRRRRGRPGWRRRTGQPAGLHARDT